MIFARVYATFVYRLYLVSFIVHIPITASARSTSIDWMLETGTTPWQTRQSRTRAAHLAPIQSLVITTETYRPMTFGQHTLSQAEVLTSSNRPVQEVVYKNLSVQTSHSSSSVAFNLGQYCPTGQLILISLMITIFTRVLSHVSY